MFWPARGTCGLKTGGVGLVDGGLQRREGCRRARGTTYILGGKIAMRERTWYMHQGFRGGREAAVARGPGSPSKRLCSFRGGGRPGDICVPCDVQHGISWARRKGL